MGTLSLLSRGNAQVVKTTQEKIEIHYDAEDYFNWRSHNNFQIKRFLRAGYSSDSILEVQPPKTYSTRKGALVLFSEDLASPWWYGSKNNWAQRPQRLKRKKFTLELKTLQDLTGAILAYGRKQKHNGKNHWQPYLRILREEENQRQIRPGYSPKRYLFRLFETWDPNAMYKLQQAGNLRNSSHQPIQNSSAETNKKHQDLSSVPLKYQNLPVLASHSHPLWTCPNVFRSSGHCTPVQEAETEDEKAYSIETGEENNSQMFYLPVPDKETRRKDKPESRETYEEKVNSRNKGHLLEVKQDEEGGGRTDISANPFLNTDALYGNDFNDPFNAKPHSTFYGGPFTGRKKNQNSKQDTVKQQNEEEVGFFPPISQIGGAEPTLKKDSNTKEPVKLPPIFNETPQATYRKRRRQASDPPKELLVIPLLIHFHPPRPKQEEKASKTESNQIESQSQSIGKKVNDVSSLNDDGPVKLPEPKIKTLQMDIEWNVYQHEGDIILPMSEAPPLGYLPPINGKKGPGLANKKVSNVNNSNTNVPKTLPTGIIRGLVPEELKEYCKNNSLGSLIMSPDGEIVCLSLMGSTRQTDVRFDFIAEHEAEEDEDE
ncbi:hypothetical protein GDO86_017082, partial [Hymenochirus boettgeri]